MTETVAARIDEPRTATYLLRNFQHEQSFILLNYPTDIILCPQELASLLLRERQGERRVLELINGNGVHIGNVGSFVLIDRAKEKEQFLHLIDSRLRAANQHTGNNQVFDRGPL
jgi:hypothetical protein